MPKPEITIIICTRNRAESLRDTLASIDAVRIPPRFDVELLVVDNGSSDHTREVVQTSRLSAMELRYCYEPAPGLSIARNAGLRESTGDIVVFTDDDVRPAADWLVRLEEPIISFKVDAVVGRVTIPKDRQMPWFTILHRSWLASTERFENGSEAVELIGANMAFRRDLIIRAAAFDPNLGAGALGFAEDRLFSLQLKRRGHEIHFARDAVIEHHFDLSRTHPSWFLAMAERMGRSEAYLAYHWFGRSSAWLDASQSSRVDENHQESKPRSAIHREHVVQPAEASEARLIDRARYYFQEQFQMESLKSRRYRTLKI